MSADLPRVYLLLGPETGEKSVYLKQLRTALRTEFSLDPEIHRFYPFDTLNGEIFAALENNSLFSEHRLVILSQAEILQAAQVKELATYLKNPSDSATLVIISAETRISAKLTSLIPKAHTKIFYEMFDNRKSEWLRGVFTAQQFAITSDAVELILELVENTTQELKTVALQLMQFVALDQRNTVTEEDVQQFIQHTRPENAFSLFDQIALGKYERALDILHALMQSQDGAAIPLIAGLLWQFRRLTSLHELLEHGARWDDAVLGVTVSGKSVAIRRKKDLGTFRSAVSMYPLASCHAIIARLGEADIAVRQMGSELQRLVLERLLGTIMIRRGKLPPNWDFASFVRDAKF
jgi:DNA polymerase-3 subunit delta